MVCETGEADVRASPTVYFEIRTSKEHLYGCKMKVARERGTKSRSSAPNRIANSFGVMPEGPSVMMRMPENKHLKVAQHEYLRLWLAALTPGQMMEAGIAVHLTWCWG